MSKSDRRLYDLCRKYKYFYKKHKAIKEVNDAFWDKDIQKACQKTEDKLCDIHDDIVTELLFPYLQNVELECDAPIDYHWLGGDRMPNPFRNCHPSYTATIHGKEFYDLAQMVILNGRRSLFK